MTTKTAGAQLRGNRCDAPADPAYGAASRRSTDSTMCRRAPVTPGRWPPLMTTLTPGRGLAHLHDARLDQAHHLIPSALDIGEHEVGAADPPPPSGAMENAAIMAVIVAYRPCCDAGVRRPQPKRRTLGLTGAGRGAYCSSISDQNAQENARSAAVRRGGTSRPDSRRSRARMGVLCSALGRPTSRARHHVLRASWRILLTLSSTPNAPASFPALTRKM
jgi:hypothetical protein